MSQNNNIKKSSSWIRYWFLVFTWLCLYWISISINFVGWFICLPLFRQTETERKMGAKRIEKTCVVAANTVALYPGNACSTNPAAECPDYVGLNQPWMNLKQGRLSPNPCTNIWQVHTGGCLICWFAFQSRNDWMQSQANGIWYFDTAHREQRHKT